MNATSRSLMCRFRSDSKILTRLGFQKWLVSDADTDSCPAVACTLYKQAILGHLDQVLTPYFDFFPIRGPPDRKIYGLGRQLAVT